MTNEAGDVTAVLKRAPYFACGTALFLMITIGLFGVLYFTLMAGAAIGAVSLVFFCISFWKKKMLFQTLGTIVVISSLVGMRAPFLPTMQTVCLALLVVTLPLTFLKPQLLKLASHG